MSLFIQLHNVVQYKTLLAHFSLGDCMRELFYNISLIILTPEQSWPLFGWRNDFHFCQNGNSQQWPWSLCASGAINCGRAKLCRRMFWWSITSSGKATTETLYLHSHIKQLNIHHGWKLWAVLNRQLGILEVRFFYQRLNITSFGKATTEISYLHSSHQITHYHSMGI